MEQRLLGKQPYRHDDRTLMLARYFDGTSLLQAPAVYTVPHAPTSWPMFLNDQLGDCTCAAAAHMLEAWTAANRAEVTVTDADVLAGYEAVAGYNPTDGSHDDGAVELDVLRYWRTTGIAGHRIGAFASVDVGTKELVKLACWLFGGLYIGLALPKGVQNANGVWSIPTHHSSADWQPWSWGGHAVNVIGYDTLGVWLVTWGQRWRCTWGFWRAYVDECWSILDLEWLSGGRSAAGFDLAALEADLARVGKVAA